MKDDVILYCVTIMECVLAHNLRKVQL